METTNNRDAWFLAQLKPNSDAIALRNLARQGFTTFQPTQTVSSRRGSRFIERRRALFPGYLFVAFDPAGGVWRKINSTLGISRLVAFGATPAPVPDTLVDGLIARCDTEGHLRPAEDFAPGDRVRVASGALASFVAEVERIDPDRRVWALIEIIGRQTRGQFAPEDLRKE